MSGLLMTSLGNVHSLGTLPWDVTLFDIASNVF